MAKRKQPQPKPKTKPKTAGPVRVLFLSAEGLVGGAERSLYELLCALPEERVEAQACVPPEGTLARLCALAEVPVHPVPMRRFWRTLHPFLLAGQIRALFRGAQAIHAIVKQQDIRVLHANTDSAALVAWEVSRESGIPFVWHCRDLRPLGRMARLLGRSAAAVVAISHAVERHLLAQGVEAAKVRCIPNGIDLARLHPLSEREAVRAGTRAYLGVDPATPLILDVGAWVPWKRHELFLEALAQVRKRIPQARGVLAGSDLYRQNAGYVEMLESQAEALGLDEEALLVLSQREDIPELMAAADLLVLPSEREPFGRVLAEAGAAGLPAVACEGGAQAEIVKDGVTGRVVPAATAASLAEACVGLLKDPERRRRMGENAIVRVAELFDVRRTAADLAELFEEVARQPPKKRKR